MKAFILKKYGSPQNLEITESEIESPVKNQILIKIKALTINDFDWSLIYGKPYIYRLMFGWRKPKHSIPGIELSGEVEAVGEGVSKFKIGDQVYGDISENGWGTYAEYATVSENQVRIKPLFLSHEAAVAVPHASLLAYQSLIGIARIKENERILINGAGGGMGTFCFYMAKKFNAHITGVDSGDKLEKLESMGFDDLIDYQKTDFTQNGVKYDLIIDAKTNRNPSKYKKSLSESGRYVTVGGSLTKLIRILISRLLGNKKLHILSVKPNKGLEEVEKLMKELDFSPVIDGPYEFHEIPELIDYFGKGKHFGKVVVSV